MFGSVNMQSTQNKQFEEGDFVTLDTKLTRKMKRAKAERAYSWAFEEKGVFKSGWRERYISSFEIFIQKIPFSEVVETAEKIEQRKENSPYINDTQTQTGLSVQAHLVTETYEKGVKVPDEEMDALCIQPHAVCPQWNYTIYPRASQPHI